MTNDERLGYGSLAAHVELREDIVRHAAHTLTQARRIQISIAVAATIMGVLELVSLLMPGAAPIWLPGHAVALTIGLGFCGLLALVNAWCSKQRAADSRAKLVEYVNRLPAAD